MHLSALQMAQRYKQHTPSEHTVTMAVYNADSYSHLAVYTVE